MARTAPVDRPQPMPSEVALAVECCRWSFAGGDPRPVETLAQAVRWDRLVQVSRRHRVQGLIWHCLHGLLIPVPADARRTLAEDAAALAEHNLRAVRQSALLLEAFDKAAIPLIFVKGLSLSKLAYGDPCIKMSQDIDLLVPGDAVVAASTQLGRLGYRLVVPAQSAGLERWHRERKESVWSSPDGLPLELHSRLADGPGLIPGIDTGSPRQQVEIAPGIVLPTLAPDELFAYLCVHGASSAWFRLKWITDLAALVHGCTATQIERLYDRSQQLGAGRAAAQALLLARGAYGTEVSGKLEQRLLRDRVNRWLVDTAWTLMLRPSEPTETRFGTVMIHVSQPFLLPGVRMNLGEWARKIGQAWAGLVKPRGGG